MRTVDQMTLDGLRAVKEYGPYNRGYGICFQIQTYFGRSLEFQQGMPDLHRNRALGYYMMSQALLDMGLDADCPVEKELGRPGRLDLLYPRINSGKRFDMWAENTVAGARRWVLLDQLIKYYEEKSNV